jgi:hypothetical protein
MPQVDFGIPRQRLKGLGLSLLDQFQGSAERATCLMTLYPQGSACLAEQTIALRNGLEYPNELFQEFQALRLGLPGLWL